MLKITQGIGGDEIAYFLEWVDFAGNGVQAPVAPVTDPQTGFTFPNFFLATQPKRSTQCSQPKQSADSAQPNLSRPWDPLESTCRHASLSIL